MKLNESYVKRLKELDNPKFQSFIVDKKICYLPDNNRGRLYENITRVDFNSLYSNIQIGLFNEGLIGKEEIEIIKPAIKEAKNNLLIFGPYPADAFFARGMHEKFDAVLAMYHDQGLIPFKSLAFGEGVNYTAGLPAVRTSPDHGTAFDIAGKGKADHASFLAATFECIDIINRRLGYADRNRNPLRKISARMLANAVDERIEENEG